MRVNVYAEEMTGLVEIIGKVIEGHEFTGLRLYLQLPATVGGAQYQGPFMHRSGDDDSSAVTFWGKQDLRDVLRTALAKLDEHYASRAAPYDSFSRLDRQASSAPAAACDTCDGDSYDPVSQTHCPTCGGSFALKKELVIVRGELSKAMEQIQSLCAEIGKEDVSMK